LEVRLGSGRAPKGVKTPRYFSRNGTKKKTPFGDGSRGIPGNWERRCRKRKQTKIDRFPKNRKGGDREEESQH